jgi:hypothetical protein
MTGLEPARRIVQTVERHVSTKMTEIDLQAVLFGSL